MSRNKKYGAKLRKVYNEKTKEIREVYCAVICDNKALYGQIFVASNGKLLEFKTKESALEKAKEIYEKFKGQLW